jgi:hypothetical protein
MTKQETEQKYFEMFPTAENPFLFQFSFSYDQIIDFMNLAIEEGEPLIFEEPETENDPLLDAINCKLNDEILIAK